MGFRGHAHDCGIIAANGEHTHRGCSDPLRGLLNGFAWYNVQMLHHRISCADLQIQDGEISPSLEASYSSSRRSLLLRLTHSRKVL